MQTETPSRKNIGKKNYVPSLFRISKEIKWRRSSKLPLNIRKNLVGNGTKRKICGNDDVHVQPVSIFVTYYSAILTSQFKNREC
jgi:hypothetical protein